MGKLERGKPKGKPVKVEIFDERYFAIDVCEALHRKWKPIYYALEDDPAATDDKWELYGEWRDKVRDEIADGFCEIDDAAVLKGEKEAKRIADDLTKRVKAMIAEYRKAERQRAKEEAALYAEAREIVGSDDFIIIGNQVLYGTSSDELTPEERAESDRLWSLTPEEYRQEVLAKMTPEEQESFNRAWDSPIAKQYRASLEAKNNKMNGNGHANGHDVTASEPPKKKHDFDDHPAERTDHFAGWSPPHHDLFGAFAVPRLERKHVTERYRDIVFSNSESFGFDAGALYEAINAVWSAIIPATTMQIKPVAANDTWKEAARLWIMIVGEAGANKSSLMKIATAPLVEIDTKFNKEYMAEQAAWEKLEKKDRGDKDPPRLTTVLVSDDFSTEGLQGVAIDNPAGMLLYADEIRAVFDAALRFSSTGSNHTARAFMLKAHNSEFTKTIRADQRKNKTGFPSYSVLGSIQPDLLHELASDADNNDGMTHRLNAVFINSEDAPKPTDKDPSHPMELHNTLVKSAYRKLLNVNQTFTLSDKANDVRKRMDDWITEQREIYSFGNAALARGLLKWRGYFARRCMITHVIENFDKPHIPATISAETANHVFTYMTEFLFEHTKAFYNLAAANDEHQILRAILEHALIRNKRTLTVNDLAEGSRQLSKIDRSHLKRFMEKLEALGYCKIMVRANGKYVRHDSMAVEMNPYLFADNVALAKKLRLRNEAWEAAWKAARQRKKPG